MTPDFQIKFSNATHLFSLRSSRSSSEISSNFKSCLRDSSYLSLRLVPSLQSKDIVTSIPTKGRDPIVLAQNDPPKPIRRFDIRIRGFQLVQYHNIEDNTNEDIT